MQLVNRKEGHDNANGVTDDVREMPGPPGCPVMFCWVDVNYPQWVDAKAAMRNRIP
jgi:hypothetical protein